MKKVFKAMQIMVALVLLLGMLGPAAAFPAETSSTKAHPLLVETAAQNPDQQVVVIVQKQGEGHDLEARVDRLGGQVTKDLQIINAFAAQLTARDALKLAGDPSVRWMSMDAPVESTGKPPKGEDPPTASMTVRDEFNLVDYNNNDGTSNWSSGWVEYDDDGSASTGYVQVDGNQLHLENKDGGVLESAQRALDLTEATSAVFTFDYSGFGEGGLDIFAVDVSSDGTNFTTLENFEVVGPVSGSRSYNLHEMASLSANFTIRFRLVQGFAATTQFIAFDNVQVEFEIPSSISSENTYLDTLKVQDVWAMGYQGQGIGIAVIDSGIDHDDVDQRIAFEAAFNGDNNVLDNTGHGTHVAGIVAGDGSGSNGTYKGVAPEATLLALNVSDNNGAALESDVVAAMQWVFDNKETYNIRIVNLSLNSTVTGSYHESPMNAAAEILWFNGVVVIAAAGNSGTNAQIDTIQAAPANDPFLITVGATDEQGTVRKQDDVIPTFSPIGMTLDYHDKPDIMAPGMDILSTLPTYSGWKTTYPERVTKIGKHYYFRASGTSMAAPMVAGAAALLLQAEPDLTPDQVKYRLTWTASVINGYSYLDVYEALTWPTYESANTGLEASQLLWTGDEPIVWGSVAWNSVAWNSVAWNSVAWNSVAWNSVAWNSVAWNE